MEIPAGRPLLMGILNVTPDSFSDGGVHYGLEAAVDGALRMVEEGADLVDVGGESTRPGADEVPLDEERRRVVPVVEALASRGVAVSVDTRRAAVAREALAAGARVVNDVTALGDPEMASVVAASGATVCLMHMRGTPRTMQANPEYGDVVEEIRAFLVERAETAVRAGIARERIWTDPGIGFGKTVAHNLALLRHLDRFVTDGYPVLIGVSRKTFLGKLLGSDAEPLPTSERLEGTLAAQVLAQAAGARIVRAHDVRASRRAMAIAAAVLGG